jgi:hypothetical protein
MPSPSASFTLGSKPETYTEADGDEVRRLIAAASAVVEQRATSGPDVEDVILDFIYVCDEDQFDRGLHQGKKYRPVQSEISEISRLPARSEIFPLSSEIFIFLKFCHPNRHQSPSNTLTLIHV